MSKLCLTCYRYKCECQTTVTPSGNTVTGPCPETGDLFAPHNNTRTSRAAAESVDIDTVRTQRGRIMRFVLEQGDATRDDIEAALDLAGDAVRPRCRKLEEDSWLMPTARTRPTRKGREATVYQPTPKAWAWWNEQQGHRRIA